MVKLRELRRHVRKARCPFGEDLLHGGTSDALQHEIGTCDGYDLWDGIALRARVIHGPHLVSTDVTPAVTA